MKQSFANIINLLHKQKGHKRVAVVCPDDEHTEYVITRSLQEGIADFVLIAQEGHTTRTERIQLLHPEGTEVLTAATQEEAAGMGVALVREGRADVLMKGTINTDKLLRAVLNKEHGLLPQGRVLSHVTAAQIPTYHKLLLFSDAAVIPQPSLEQMESILACNIGICHRLGIEEPRVALIHCNEKENEKFPHTLSYRTIKERQSRDGRYGKALIGGPMDVKTACDMHSGMVKGIQSPVVGNADVLLFSNIEAGNTFYKTLSLFAHADMAGMLTGTVAPVVLPSRADSDESKYYSLVLACVVGGEAN